MEAYVAETKNLTKYFGKCCALDGVSLRLRRGEIYGLIGDNGAGKSTLLKLLSGQIFVSGGEIALFGESTQEGLRRMRGRTGVLIEEAGFFPQLSVEQNLEYFRIQKGVAGKTEVGEALELTGLTAVRKKRGTDLSLGMKQRLGLAIALIGTPELLILDEPVNGLDPSGIMEIRNLLIRLNQERGITILLSSHILSELEQMATVYGFLQKGRLLEQITVRQLAQKCADYVVIRVSDAQQYAVLLEQELHHGSYQIMADGSIHILGADERTERYGALAAGHGLQVQELVRHKRSLEEYYMKLKNGGSAPC